MRAATLTQRGMSNLGEDLRAARDARKLSLQDVSDNIHIRATFLDAMEREHWSAVAEPVYVRGFLRTYARFLALDPAEAVRRFDAALPPEAKAPPAALVRAAEPPRAGFSPLVRFAALGALVLAAFVVVSFLQMRAADRATNAVARATAAPTVPPTPPATPRAVATTAASGLALRLVGRSWISVRVDGKTVLEGLYPAGASAVLHGTNVLVRAGNAGGVTVALPGEAPVALGAPGVVVERRFALPAEKEPHGNR